MLGKQLLACAILLTIGHAVDAEYNVSAYCTMVRDGLKLASGDDCSKYYTCFNNGHYWEQRCPANEFFDKNQQSCYPSYMVHCTIGAKDPCSGRNNVYVPMLGNCRGWIYCKDNVELGRGECGASFIFDQGQCNYGECKSNMQAVNPSNDLASVCDIMPDGTYFGSLGTCSKWQKCNDGILKFGQCQNGLVYDVQVERCNYENYNTCARVTGDDIQPDTGASTRCDSENALTADSRKCSVYYVCQNGLNRRQECPFNHFFDVTSQACKIRQLAKPVDSCNRCQFSSKAFVNAVDENCKAYQACSNGVKISSGKCPDNNFFNEASQTCVPITVGFAQYTSQNGACEGTQIQSFEINNYNQPPNVNSVQQPNFSANFFENEPPLVGAYDGGAPPMPPNIMY